MTKKSKNGSRRNGSSKNDLDKEVPGKDVIPYILIGVVALGAIYLISTVKNIRDQVEFTLQSVPIIPDILNLKPSKSANPEPNMTVYLSALNASRQSGTAVLSDMGGKTKVTLNIRSGAVDVAQPAHIHMGSCPNPDAIKYPLTDVVNGQSETVLNVSMQQIKTQEPLAVNIHKSADQIKTYVSCGNLK